MTVTVRVFAGNLQWMTLVFADMPTIHASSTLDVTTSRPEFVEFGTCFDLIYSPVRGALDREPVG